MAITNLPVPGVTTPNWGAQLNSGIESRYQENRDRIDTLETTIDEIDPVDGYDVILLGGQSNMVGQGTPVDTTYFDTPDPRIFQWAGSGTHLGTQVLATQPLLHHGTYAGVGPGLSFAKWYVREYGRNVLLVPVAHSATGFTTTSISPAASGYHYVAGGGSWNKAATDGGTNLYSYAVSQCNAAIASNENNRLVAILWQHGSADGAFVSGALNQAQFQGLMDDLVENFRADITGAATVPILIGRETPDYYVAHSGDLWTDKVHLNMPVSQVLTEWVAPTPVLGGTEVDGVHINAYWQRQAGSIRYPEAYELAKYNILTTQPVTPTDLVMTQSGTTVRVSWTRGLGRNTNYLVEKDTGSGWSTVTRTTEPTETFQDVTGLTLGNSVDFRVSAINEHGTSDAVTGTLVLQNTPAAPTGLAGTPSAWSNRITWNAVAGATSYFVEYKAAASGTWLSAGTVTTTAKTVGSLIPSTSYNFRVSATNLAGTGSASSTLTQSTTAATYLSADAGTDPIWAYSVRKVRSAYSGSCLRVRRSSDNTQQDIGFDGNGLLDETALLAFTGGGNGFVVKWYNQGTSGSNQDVFNNTAAFQPRIVNAGVVDKKNSLPAPVWDGTDDFISHLNPQLLAQPGLTVMNVAQTRKANSCLFAEVYNPASVALTRWVAFYAGPGLQEYLIVFNDLAADATLLTANAITDDDSLNQETAADTLMSLQMWRNGTSVIGPTSYSRSGAHTTNLFNVGVGFSPQYHQGCISELVFWGVALSDASRLAAEANQRGYFATP